MDDKGNYILAIALSLVILIAWQFFYVAPQMEQQEARQEAIEQRAEEAGAPRPDVSAVPQATLPQDTLTPSGAQTRQQVLAASPRIELETPAVSGSVSLRGGRIDDVVLKDYKVTVEPDSPNIVLLSPSGSPDPFYAELGWVAGSEDVAVPGQDTVWTAPDGARLTPDTPVTLSWDNGEGLVFNRTIAVDREYMFTVTDTVENTGNEPVTLHPFGLISRHGTPTIEGFFILHEGLIGVLGEEGLQEIDYDDLIDDGTQQYQGSGGWLGITDKYWAAVLVPEQDNAYRARFSPGSVGDTPTYQSDFLLDGIDIAPGGEASNTSRVFAGAKRVDVIDGYEEQYGIRNFELLIDWGWFYFITKPLFFVIDWFFRLVGNFGVAILLTTVVIKLFFFPLANKSYVSMSRMKKVQPELMEMRERYKDDRMKQQQMMMELYKKERINPLSGCLPIVVQIPVFFALYKVLFVTIEMRHAPFFGWIQDLAAPDPTSIFNLFGLVPWDPPSFLMIGVWPLIMGFTMWVQMRLNPPPPDPTQAMIFNWMPVMFTFLLATFPAGLVIYWAWNNFLSILQQYAIMRRQGVEVNLLGNIRQSLPGAKKKAEEKPAAREPDETPPVEQSEPAAERPARKKPAKSKRARGGRGTTKTVRAPGE